MIEPTVKAQTLPDDLKKHWEDAMATKFPMTRSEAMAYIQNRYQGINVVMSGQDNIQAEWQERKPATEGVAIPPGWMVQYVQFPAYGYSSGTSLNSYRNVPSYMYRYEQVIISDFRKTAIDEKLKDYKP